MSKKQPKLTQVCSFCGIHDDDEKCGILVATYTVAICGSCISDAVNCIADYVVDVNKKAKENAK